MKRIYNGFTAESQRTNDGPAFACPFFLLQNY